MNSATSREFGETYHLTDGGLANRSTVRVAVGEKVGGEHLPMWQTWEADKKETRAAYRVSAGRGFVA